MAGHTQNLVDLVDERIRAQREVIRTTGTYVGPDDTGTYALVSFDGDPLPMPVKWAAGTGWIVPETRVALDRYGSDWYITAGLSQKAYWIGKRQSDSTTISFNNTSAALGTPEVGVVFTAPLSGAVWMTIGGQVGQGTSGITTFLSYSVRTGSTWAVGQQVTAFSSARSISTGSTGVAWAGSGSFRYVLDALVPGELYIARAGHWCSAAGGSGSVNARYLAVEAVG